MAVGTRMGTHEVASHLGITPQTIRNRYRKRPDDDAWLPPFQQVLRGGRYDLEVDSLEFEAWVKINAVDLKPGTMGIHPMDDPFDVHPQSPHFKTVHKLFKDYMVRAQTFAAAGVVSKLDGMVLECIDALFWILDESPALVPFKLRPAQLRLLADILEMVRNEVPIRIIVCKARQIGISTLIAAWHFYRGITHPYSKNVVMAHDRESAEHLFGMYETYYNNLPEDIRPAEGVGKRRGRKLVLEQLGVTFQVLVSTERTDDDAGKTGRSRTVHNAHLSEVPFWRNPSATMNAFRKCVPLHPHTSIILESTPRTYGDTFHTARHRAVAGDTDSHSVFGPGFENDEYRIAFDSPELRDEFTDTLGDNKRAAYGHEIFLMDSFPDITIEHLAWRRYKIRNDCEGDLRNFERDFPATAEEGFQRTSGNWLVPMVMEKYQQRTEDPVEVGEFRAPSYGETPSIFDCDDPVVRIYVPRQEYHEYCAGSDSAEGNEGGDYSSTIIFDRWTEEPVCEIRGTFYRQLSQAEFAYQTLWGLRYYNDAHFCPESNYGQVIKALFEDEFQYTNLLRANQLKIGGQALSKHPTKLGWWKSQQTMLYVQALTKEWFEAGWQKDGWEPRSCRIARLVDEASSAIKDGDRVRAPNKHAWSPGKPEGGYFDDTLHAFFGALIAHNSLPDAENPRNASDDEEFEQLTFKYEQMMQTGVGNAPAKPVIPASWRRQRFSHTRRR